MRAINGIQDSVAVVTGASSGIGRAAAVRFADEGASVVAADGGAETVSAIRDGGGAIVNTSSIAGVVGFAGVSPYVASKHGVIGLTKTAALEYSREGVRVNAISPGVIRTPMVDRAEAANPEMIDAVSEATPMGRIGDPEEIGDAAVWLRSDDASFVTGETLVIDGGYVSQ